MTIRKWDTDPDDPYSRRPIYANGERGPKIDCRPMFESFLREIDLAGLVREAVAEAVRAEAMRL
jgi:hypothetical protein